MPEHIDPERTPGEAMMSADSANDFTLPAALYHDAVSFLRDAIAASAETSHDAIYLEGRYSTSAILSVFAGLEATINQAAFGHAAAHQGVLQQLTRDVLTERETTIDESGRILTRTRYWSFESRTQFVVRFLAGKPLPKTSRIWQDLRKASALRDSCAHPKPPFRRPDVEDARFAVRSVRTFLLELSTMMGEEPSLWLAPDPEEATG